LTRCFTASEHLPTLIISNETVWDLYEKMRLSFWTPQEVEFSKDLVDWEEKLTKDERYFISRILAFFASADGIVGENLISRFLEDAKSAVARNCYCFQSAIEAIHSEMYSLFISTLVKDPKEQDLLFTSIETIPCITNKAKWAMQWIHSNTDSYASRLVAFACIEGIFFSGAFCSIFWLKKRGLMPGLAFSNELISRDESMHTELAIILYHQLSDEEYLSENRIHEIIRESVELEKSFICDALSCSLIGMNSKLMSNYIEFVADRLSLQFGANKIYDTQNPFSFMDMISLEGKTNFFEKKVGEYSKLSNDLTISKKSMIETIEDTDF